MVMTGDIYILNSYFQVIFIIIIRERAGYIYGQTGCPACIIRCPQCYVASYNF